MRALTEKRKQIDVAQKKTKKQKGWGTLYYAYKMMVLILIVAAMAYIIVQDFIIKYLMYFWYVKYKYNTPPQNTSMSEKGL